LTARHEAPRPRRKATRVDAVSAATVPDETQFRSLHRPGASLTLRIDVADPGWDPTDLVDPLAGAGNVYLLETAGGPVDLEQRTILAWNPEREYVLRAHELETRWRGGRSARRTTANPLAELRAAMADEGAVFSAQGEGFSGGLVGYVSYDFKNHLERLPDTVADDLGVPELRLGFVRRVLVWDRRAGTLGVRVSVKCGRDPGADWKRSQRELQAVWEEVRRAAASIGSKGSAADRAGGRSAPVSRHTGTAPGAASRTPGASARVAGVARARSNLTRRDYDRMLARCHEHILAGDIYQANLSHRMAAPFLDSGLELYRTLRAINPSPFAAYLRFPEHEIVSCSPERLVKLERGRVETRPIAGTRPRARDRAADRALQQDLLANEKERAEHLMIVDMARNDIGRVCEPGSVEVEPFMRVEAYSHVRHLVSHVTGTLRADRDGFDLLAATFPGASITGVPKVRCMQIVDALERVRRGVYTGSAGYIGLDGCMDFNILIRTFFVQSGRAYFHVGGGIVADSQADREYAETLAKGRALQEALASIRPATAPKRGVSAGAGAAPHASARTPPARATSRFTRSRASRAHVVT
jgi:anthranilate/para-aminobenzoate synthase component I